MLLFSHRPRPACAPPSRVQWPDRKPPARRLCRPWGGQDANKHTQDATIVASREERRSNALAALADREVALAEPRARAEARDRRVRDRLRVVQAAHLGRRHRPAVHRPPSSTAIGPSARRRLRAAIVARARRRPSDTDIDRSQTQTGRRDRALGELPVAKKKRRERDTPPPPPPPRGESARTPPPPPPPPPPPRLVVAEREDAVALRDEVVNDLAAARRDHHKANS